MANHAGRPLGALERVVDLVDRARSLNFVVIGDLRGPLAPAALRAALDAAQRLHPLLGVRIDRRGATPRFCADGVGPIPLRVIDGAAPTAEVATAELNAPLPRDAGPLVRATWIVRGGDGGTLMLTFNHTIGDGASGALLLRDVVAVAGGAAPRAPLPLPAPLEERLPRHTRGAAGIARLGRFVAREVAGHVGRRALPQRVRCEVRVPVEAVEARLVQRELDRATVAALIARARAEGTSVHGALEAALMRAFVRCEAGDRPCVVCMGAPVNLRVRLEPPIGDDVGMFVALAQATHRVDPSAPFWALARAARGALAASVERGEPLAFAPVVAWLVAKVVGASDAPDAPGRAAALVQRAMSATTGITNLGALAIPRHHGPLTIERVQFVVSPSAMADLVTTAATFDGVLCWNFVYNAPRVSAARVERLADAAVAALQAAVA